MNRCSPEKWRDRLLIAALSAIAFLWPAILNGGPFWFPDTSTYVRGADAAVVALTGRRSEWSDFLVPLPAGVAPRTSTRDSAKRERGTQINPSAHFKPSVRWVPTRPVLTGRSIYYGFLVYLPMRVFGPWGGVILQSLIVSGLILSSLLIASRATGQNPRVILPVAVAGLAILTPLPFYTSMLMPDIYAGVLVLVLTTVLLFWEELTWKKRIGLITACAVLATFHTTHILLVVAVGGVAILILPRGKPRLRSVVVTFPILLVAFLGEAAFSYAVTTRLGQPPLSPPFLSARITAAGPGTTFLERTCSNSANQFALCAHRHRLPLHSDNFLWSEDQKNGLFQLLGREEQRRMADEDKRFFLNVLVDDPTAVLSASMQAFLQQMTAFDLNNFNYSNLLKASALQKLPPAAKAQFVESRAFAGQMPVNFTIIATITATMISILLMGIAGFIALRSRTEPKLAANKLALMLVLGVLANALICGSLSKPGARYQMRIIWLIPIAALATTFVARNRIGSRGDDAGERLPARSRNT